MKDREKELKYLIYLKGQLIKEAKKDIKKYHKEIEEIHKEKRKKYENRKN